MRHQIALAPDVALFIVICRMAALGLWRERTSFFVFLCVWFLFCAATAVIAQATPHTDAKYAMIYSALQLCVAITIIPAGIRTFLSISGSGVLTVAFVGLTAAFSPLILEFRIPLSFGVLGIFGLTLLASSFFAKSPDSVLFSGVGSYLLVFVAGVFFARKFGHGPAAYEWLALLCAAIWIALAWKIGPNPDALINPAKLALTPFAKIIFGIARSARG